MNTSDYANKLETKMIKEFKERFKEKIGYEPIVLTQVHMTVEQDGVTVNVPIMTLEDLEEAFTDLLPVYFGKRHSLQSSLRKRELVDLRSMFCRLAVHMRYTLVSIGRYLGGRDHTTVIHNLKTFKNQIETNPGYRSTFYHLLEHIKKSKSDDPSVVEHLDQISIESELTLLS